MASVEGEFPKRDGDDLYASEVNTSYYGSVPIGAVVFVDEDLTGVPAPGDSFQKCDGSEITDAESPMFGENIRDMITDNRVARSAATSGGTGGSAAATLTKSDAVAGAGLYAYTESTLPTITPYTDLVPYMRIK